MLSNKRLTLEKLKSTENIRKELAVRRSRDKFIRTYAKSVVPTNNNSGVFWDNKFRQIADRDNFVEADRNKTAYRWVRDIIHPGMRVLNVGCGDGKFEKCIPRDFFQKIEYMGIDFARRSISVLRGKYPNATFVYGDIREVKLKNGYDIVCAFEVFEHIRDADIFSVIKKLRRSLSFGGYLFIAVPLNEPY